MNKILVIIILLFTGFASYSQSDQNVKSIIFNGTPPKMTGISKDINGIDSGSNVKFPTDSAVDARVKKVIFQNVGGVVLPFFHENFNRTTANIAGSTNGVPGSFAVPLPITAWYAWFGSGSSPLFTSGGVVGCAGFQYDSTNMGASGNYDAIITMGSVAAGGGTFGMLFNYDGTNSLQVIIVGANLQIIQNISSTATTIYSGTNTLTDHDVVKLRTIGSSVFLYRNGTLLGGGTYNNAVLTGTTMVLQFNNTSATVDDIIINTIPSAIYPIAHDATLTGTGDIRSPLSVVSSGTGSGITLGQLDSASKHNADSLRISLGLDTTYHLRTLNSTTATTINWDTVYYTGGINEALYISAEVIAHAVSGGGSYHAVKHTNVTLSSGTQYPTTGSGGPITISDQPDEYTDETASLSGYTFSYVYVGTRIVFQVTTTSATTNASILYHVTRIKL